MQLNPEKNLFIGKIYVIKKGIIAFEDTFQFSSDRHTQYSQTSILFNSKRYKCKQNRILNKIVFKGLFILTLK